MKRNPGKQFIGIKSQQVYESDTYCPSIERALFKECKLEEILVQSQLKKAGIKTADSLIHVLYEEIKSLKGQKDSLELQIMQMLRQFSQKEQDFKRQISFLEIHLKEVIQIKEAVNSRSSLSKCFLPNSSRKLSVPKSIEKKLYESPIRKMSLVETVSKEYVEHGIERGAMICQEAVSVLLSKQMERMIVDFGQMDELLREEKNELKLCIQKHEKSEEIVKQLSKQLKTPLDKSAKYDQNTRQMSKYQSGSKSLCKKYDIKGKKLFSTEISNDASPDRIKFLSSWQDRVKQESKCDKISQKLIIKEYQDIIQQYKEYSAYLKAYLCSCIEFISKQTQYMAENNGNSQKDGDIFKNLSESQCLSTDRSSNMLNFPSNKIFDVVLGNILSNVQEKIVMEHEIRKQLEEENRELRNVLDQLVDNLKKSGIQARRQQTGKIKLKNAAINRNNHRIPQINRVTMTEYKGYNNYEDL